MSRLRRPFLSDRYLFVTSNLLKTRSPLGEDDFKWLAAAISRMHSKQRFVLTAWVFLPDHWHAIVYPPYPLTIARIFQAVKVSSMISLNHGRRESGELWQGRFFDHALRTVKEYWDTVEYIHWNPVRRGLAQRIENWRWSSVHEYAGMSPAEQEQRCGLTIDRVQLPGHPNAKI